LRWPIHLSVVSSSTTHTLSHTLLLSLLLLLLFIIRFFSPLVVFSSRFVPRRNQPKFVTRVGFCGVGYRRQSCVDYKLNNPKFIKPADPQWQRSVAGRGLSPKTSKFLIRHYPTISHVHETSIYIHSFSQRYPNTQTHTLLLFFLGRRVRASQNSHTGHVTIEVIPLHSISCQACVTHTALKDLTSTLFNLVFISSIHIISTILTFSPPSPIAHRKPPQYRGVQQLGARYYYL
jgi:hypothetical protein